MSPLAVTVGPRRFGVVLAVALAACSSTERFEAGALSKAQIETCARVERAYREQDPEYPAWRDAAVADPAVANWLVRLFVIDVSRVRERQGVRGDDFMRAAARTDDETMAARAIAEIAALGDKAVPVLVHDLLQHDQPQCRAVGVELLSKVGAPAVPALKRVVRDGETEHARAAVRVLGAIGLDAESLALLQDLARRGDWAVRADVMLGLAGGGEDARELLLRHLRTDPDPHVRRMAARSLAKFPAASSAHALVDYLDRCKREGRREGVEEAQYALQALSGTRRARTVEAWRAYAQSLDDVTSARANESR